MGASRIGAPGGAAQALPGGGRAGFLRLSGSGGRSWCAAATASWGGRALSPPWAQAPALWATWQEVRNCCAVGNQKRGRFQTQGLDRGGGGAPMEHGVRAPGLLL